MIQQSQGRDELLILRNKIDSIYCVAANRQTCEQYEKSLEKIMQLITDFHNRQQDEYKPSITDRNGDPIVGDILDIIDKNSKRYAVAVAIAEYVRDSHNRLLDELLEKKRG